MKSRTSSFNLTVFQKDITRFAPAWAVYLILLVLVLVNIADSGNAYYRLLNVQDAILDMNWVNVVYAAIVVQMIFGDLYNSRLCNALHAMPVTREGWFVSHSLSGMAFSVLPNLVITLVAFPVLRLGAGWSAVLWWLLASELQYLFCFGVAVLGIMLSGNRLGQLAIYAMVTFAGLAVYWLATAIYEPLLYGIQFSDEPFLWLSPLAWLSQANDLLMIDKIQVNDEFGNFMRNEVRDLSLGEGWGYMVGCAAVGLAALFGGLVLYRKRKLECAGDFVAFKAMEPVVQVLVTIFGGGFFHLFGDVFGIGTKYVLIFCGMVVGYFACRMLLMRTNRVFQKKAFLGCGIILAVFAMTLGLTSLDPLGVTRYMPEAEEVESVTMSQSYSLTVHQDHPFTATELADIEALLEVHADCIDGSANDTTGLHPDSYMTMNLRLEYRLKNGRLVNRFYEVHPFSEAGQILKGYYTRPECVLGFPAEQAYEMLPYLRSIYVDGMTMEQFDLEGLDLEAMMDAILADCAAGNMAQFRGYHYPNNYDFVDGDFDMSVCYLELSWDHERMETALWGNSTSRAPISYTSIRIYQSCVNTIRWLEESGLLTEEIKRELVEKYGGEIITFSTGD